MESAQRYVWWAGLWRLVITEIARPFALSVASPPWVQILLASGVGADIPRSVRTVEAPLSSDRLLRGKWPPVYVGRTRPKVWVRRLPVEIEPDVNRLTTERAAPVLLGTVSPLWIPQPCMTAFAGTIARNLHTRWAL